MGIIHELKPSLNCFKGKNKGFIHLIVTKKETWIYYDDSKKKKLQ